MPNIEQKLQWLATAKELGMRFVVLINQQNQTIATHDHVNYCHRRTDVSACLQRLAARNRGAKNFKYRASEVLDTELDPLAQAKQETAWSPNAPRR